MKYYNLTTPQQNIWNLQKFYENTAIANLCGSIFFKTQKKVDLLREAINLVVRSQTALRLRFVEQDGEVKQYVEEYSYGFYISVILMSGESCLHRYWGS